MTSFEVGRPSIPGAQWHLYKSRNFLYRRFFYYTVFYVANNVSKRQVISADGSRRSRCESEHASPMVPLRSITKITSAGFSGVDAVDTVNENMEKRQRKLTEGYKWKEYRTSTFLADSGSDNWSWSEFRASLRVQTSRHDTETSIYQIYPVE